MNSKHNELFIPLKDGIVENIFDDYCGTYDEYGYTSFIDIDIYNCNTKELENFSLTFHDYTTHKVTGLTALKLILNNTESYLQREGNFTERGNEDRTIREFIMWLQDQLDDINDK